MDSVFEKFDKTMNDVFGNIDKTIDKAFNKFNTNTKDKEKTDLEKK